MIRYFPGSPKTKKECEKFEVQAKRKFRGWIVRVPPHSYYERASWRVEWRNGDSDNRRFVSYREAALALCSEWANHV
jgi:hypothetical protein